MCEGIHRPVAGFHSRVHCYETAILSLGCPSAKIRFCRDEPAVGGPPYSGSGGARSKKMPKLKIRGYPVQPPACVEYDPRAGQVARRVIRQITRALPSVSAEHIGSTAVPGCAGKGIVDLMVTYLPGELQPVKDLLRTTRVPAPDVRPHHPESRPMRVGALRCQGQLYRIHVHVIAADSSEAGTIRAFRERLLRDPELVAAYVRCKTAIL